MIQKIRRYKKIKGSANPYDEEWQIYFEERATDKMKISLKGRKVLSWLYKTQNGFCPICGKKITVDTEYKVHENETPKGIVKILVH